MQQCWPLSLVNAVSPSLWQQMLSRAAGGFNQITVDGDTSTNEYSLALLMVNLVPQLSPKWDRSGKVGGDANSCLPVFGESDRP